MKEIYLQKNNRGKRSVFGGPGSRRRSRPVVAALSVLALAIIFALILYFLPNFSNSLGTFFAQPLWASRNFVGNQLGFVGNMFRFKSSLIEENNQLKTEIRRAEADLIFYDALAIEHKKLLYSFGQSESPSRRLAVILAKPPQSPYDTMILNIGTLVGIKNENLVYGFGNIALGRISSVEKNHSTATLFSSGGYESHGIVERSDLTVVLSGTGGGGFEAHVPQDADITVDDLIVLPGQEPSPIGKVVNIESTPASSFKLVYVSSLVNLNHTRWVEVETEVEAVQAEASI